MSKEAVQEQWRKRLAQFSASGLTQTQWCREHGLPVHQLTYWRSRLEARAGAAPKLNGNGHGTSWYGVRLVDAAADSAAAQSSQRATLTVRAGGASIEVGRGFDAVLLRAVVQALQPGGDAAC